MNLLVLSHLVDEPRWVDRIDRTLRLFADRLEQAGRAVPMMAAALSTYTAGIRQIVVIEGEGADAMERALAGRYLPFAVVFGMSRDRQGSLGELMPFVRAMHPVDGAAAAYVCQDFTCRPPITSVEELMAETGGAPALHASR
jgi:uncharacterized protein YyaL (SSP411 family)